MPNRRDRDRRQLERMRKDADRQRAALGEAARQSQEHVAARSDLQSGQEARDYDADRSAPTLIRRRSSAGDDSPPSTEITT